MRVVVLVMLVTGLLVAAPPAQADGTLTVTWPAQTVFNPTYTPYRFHVEDTGTGLLYARWRVAQWEPIPHSGDVTMPFGSDGRDRVEIWRCESEQGPCTQVDSSPLLTVYRQLYPYPDPPNEWPVVGQGPWTAAMTTDPAEAGDAVDVRWTVTRYLDRATMSTGEAASVASGPGQPLSFPVTTPDPLSDGLYLVDVGATAHTAQFGDVSGATVLRFVVDEQPLTARIEVGRPRLRATTDGAAECVAIRGTLSEPGRMRMDVQTLQAPYHEIVLVDRPVRRSARALWCSRPGHLLSRRPHRVTLSALSYAPDDSVWLTERLHLGPRP